MHILVTGSNGFIGRNLLAQLSSIKEIEIETFTKDDSVDILKEKVNQADFIYHLAGINRPKDPQEFYEGNRDLTKKIVDLLEKKEKKIPILISSSIQAEKENDYGKSKLQAEEMLKSYAFDNSTCVYIYRLPNVFGKWCRPNYNSVIATWCYNIVHDLPIQVNDASVILNLVYIDDVVHAFIESLKHMDKDGVAYCNVEPVYRRSLGEIRDLLFLYKKGVPPTNDVDGFEHALYETYMNYAQEKEENAKL